MKRARKNSGKHSGFSASGWIYSQIQRWIRIPGLSLPWTLPDSFQALPSGGSQESSGKLLGIFPPLTQRAPRVKSRNPKPGFVRICPFPAVFPGIWEAAAQIPRGFASSGESGSSIFQLPEVFSRRNRFDPALFSLDQLHSSGKASRIRLLFSSPNSSREQAAASQGFPGMEGNPCSHLEWCGGIILDRSPSRWIRGTNPQERGAIPEFSAAFGIWDKSGNGLGGFAMDPCLDLGIKGEGSEGIVPK